MATERASRPRAATTNIHCMGPPSPITRHSRGWSQAHRSPVLIQGSLPLGMSDHDITSTAQGPLRHPKPITPSDLHLVLEKEQEAMVNRLTRELSLLRQQTTSVASTASSTSTLNEPADGFHTSPSLGSSTHTHSSRRQRSSSSLSSHTAAQGSQAASVTGIAPSRETSIPSRSNDTSHPRPVRSREPSLTSRRPSIGSIPSHPQYSHGDQFTHYGSPSIYPHRNSVSQTHLGLSSSSISRYEEAALHKSELENIKRENEQLRKRVRELEDVLKKQKDGEPMTPTETPPRLRDT
ncbi:hypothetical protein PEBR_26311 [Penicillium brasilianum]|uniref:Uncharacterized protein n=1 Tax=Penicillium brasilianum TaxID=104259 RepID=A0A1S9RIP3_PENBI|nr:hypothetical protein PEBR_26311 [Penicillium brasilianum]